jgi:hypothetical protein
LVFGHWNLNGCHFECPAEGGMYREVDFAVEQLNS